MSRVEPKDTRDQEERRTQERTERRPSKAEGDERTIDEALKRQQKR